MSRDSAKYPRLAAERAESDERKLNDVLAEQDMERLFATILVSVGFAGIIYVLAVAVFFRS